MWKTLLLFGIMVAGALFCAAQGYRIYRREAVKGVVQRAYPAYWWIRLWFFAAAALGLIGLLLLFEYVNPPPASFGKMR